MNLTHLPVDIGILIFTYLDIKSKINVYSINELRQFFAPCLMRKVNISRSTIAAVKTLSLDALHDCATNIQDLNLSGIEDLTADKLFPYLQMCTNLKTLDITFTRIFLSDVEHMWCDSLKNISMNYFKWSRKHAVRKDELWKNCSEVFKRQVFERVHFIVFKFHDSESPLRFMEDIPMTKELTITVVDHYRHQFVVDEHHVSMDLVENIDIKFGQLCYIFRHCRLDLDHKTCRNLKGVSNLDYIKIEYIFIMFHEKICIYVSPVFSNMFGLNCADLTIHICPRLPLDFVLKGNIIFKAWNKEVTVFNEEFFKYVLSELSDYFPTYICMQTMLPMRITEAPSHWYCIDSCDAFYKLLDNLPEKVTLTDFCRKGSEVRRNPPVTLKPELKSMKNITFLNLINIFTKHNFFTLLFLQCKKLYTLDVSYVINDDYQEYPGLCASTTLHLLNSLNQTKSLKNLKLTLGDIDYDTVFYSVSQCTSLENVHICEDYRVLVDYEADEQNILSLVEKCYNLYSLYIEPDMSPEATTMLMESFRTAAQGMARDHLCLVVNNFYDGFNPFADVFNPSPLRITH